MSDLQPLKIGVIGLGQIAQTIHIPLWDKMPGAIVGAVHDPDKSRARAIGEKMKCKVYKEVGELLNDPDLDAVHICSPTHTHKQYTLDALAAKKHVLVEKPIGRSAEEAVEIFAEWKKTNLVVMVGMNQRFRPDSMILKSFIENQDLGDIFYIKSGWNKPIRDAHSWRLKKNQSGGGVLLDLGIMMLDLSLWLVGFPKLISVSATTFNHNIETVEDSVIVSANYAGGVITAEASWSPMVENDEQFLRVMGTSGSARLFPFKIHKMMHENLVDITPSSIGTEKHLYKRSYENELRHFIGAVRNLHKATCTPKDAVERMKLIDAIYLSAKTGKEIRF